MLCYLAAVRSLPCFNPSTQRSCIFYQRRLKPAHRNPNSSVSLFLSTSLKKYIPNCFRAAALCGVDERFVHTVGCWVCLPQCHYYCVSTKKRNDVFEVRVLCPLHACIKEKSVLKPWAEFSSQSLVSTY